MVGYTNLHRILRTAYSPWFRRVCVCVCVCVTCMYVCMSCMSRMLLIIIAILFRTNLVPRLCISKSGKSLGTNPQLHRMPRLTGCQKSGLWTRYSEYSQPQHRVASRILKFIGHREMPILSQIKLTYPYLSICLSIGLPY
jgi:hypothetical protein